MAITLTNSTSTQALAQSAAQSAARSAEADPVERALRRPVEQIDAQAQSTQVRLSAFGRLRSATTEVQDAARGLQQTTQQRSVDEVRATAQRFVNAVNAVNAGNQVTRELTANGGRRAAGVLADDAQARTANNDIRRAVGDVRNNGAEELRRIGIEVARDGTLAIDQDKFSQALQSDANTVTQTLDRVGSRVDAAATRQLSSTGSIGSAVQSLNARADRIEARRNDVQNLVDASQQAVQRQASVITNNPFLVGGAASYRGIFGL